MLCTRDVTKPIACLYELGDFALQVESDCQTVVVAAVSSLTFMLMSCVVNFEANTDNSKDPVVGSDAFDICGAIIVVTLVQTTFIPATSDMRSRRADDTDICVTHAENAGSLIRMDESESQAEDGVAVEWKEERGE
jgi:hypothetical protein